MTNLQTAFVEVILILWILMTKLLTYSNSTLGTGLDVDHICFLLILSVLSHILVFTKSPYGV